MQNVPERPPQKQSHSWVLQQTLVTAAKLLVSP